MATRDQLGPYDSDVLERGVKLMAAALKRDSVATAQALANVTDFNRRLVASVMLPLLLSWGGLLER